MTNAFDIPSLPPSLAYLFSAAASDDDTAVRTHVDPEDGKTWWRASDVLRAFDLPDCADTLVCLICRADPTDDAPVMKAMLVETPEGKTREVCVLSIEGVFILARQYKRARRWSREFGAGYWPRC